MGSGASLRQLRSALLLRASASRLRFFVLFVCAGYLVQGRTFAYFGERMSPDWNGAFMGWLFLAIGVESILSRNITRSLEGRDKWIFLASEFVFIAILIKILL